MRFRKSERRRAIEFNSQNARRVIDLGFIYCLQVELQCTDNMITSSITSQHLAYPRVNMY